MALSALETLVVEISDVSYQLCIVTQLCYDIRVSSSGSVQHLDAASARCIRFNAGCLILITAFVAYFLGGMTSLFFKKVFLGSLHLGWSIIRCCVPAPFARLMAVNSMKKAAENITKEVAKGVQAAGDTKSLPFFATRHVNRDSLGAVLENSQKSRSSAGLESALQMGQISLKEALSKQVELMSAAADRKIARENHKNEKGSTPSKNIFKSG